MKLRRKQQKNKASSLPQQAHPPLSDFGCELNEIQRLTSFTDAQIAATLPGNVTQGTISRWRNQSGPRPQRQNIHRINVLVDLARRLAQAEISPTWLRQPFIGIDKTPHDILCEGCASEVYHAIVQIAQRSSDDDRIALPKMYRDFDESADDIVEGDTWEWDDEGAGEKQQFNTPKEHAVK